MGSAKVRDTFAGGRAPRPFSASPPTPVAPAPPPQGVTESGSSFWTHWEARDWDYNSGRGEGRDGRPHLPGGAGSRELSPPAFRRWGAPRAGSGRPQAAAVGE